VSQVRRSEQASRRLPGALGGGLLGGLGDRDQGEAWNAISTLLSGICTFGAVGFGLDHLFGTGPILLIVGLLLGKGLGIYVIYARHFARYDEVKKALAATPRVAGWPTAARVAGSGPQEHPKADLRAWPYRKGTSRAS
jgi:hypothetical protein